MRRDALLALSVALSLGALACGGPRMREGELFAGRAEGPPTMSSLPDPDVVDEALSPRMHRGLELAEASFHLEPPDPPASRAALDLAAWSEGPFRAWLEQKTRAIEAARSELDVAAEESHRQRIIGGAVVGLMYEDVARALGRIPIPDDLDDEPEILDVYRDVLRSQARPFLETARRAYHACAANAIEPESMHHWSRFCAAREDELPGGLASGEVEVEVIRE